MCQKSVAASFCQCVIELLCHLDKKAALCEMCNQKKKTDSEKKRKVILKIAIKNDDFLSVSALNNRDEDAKWILNVRSLFRTVHGGFVCPVWTRGAFSTHVQHKCLLWIGPVTHHIYTWQTHRVHQLLPNWQCVSAGHSEPTDINCKSMLV